MRAAVLRQPGEPLAIVEQPDPVPGPGELLLRVDACGICGSDLHLSDAYPLPGLILGHEFCGTVEEMGPDIEGFQPGDRVTALSLNTCGACAACLAGNVRKCALARMVGIERPGGYAERVTMPARDVFRLPDALDARHGALIEPLAVALHTVDRAGLRPGEPAVVIGGGPVGLAVALWLRRLGAGEVLVSDPVPGRRALAERVGAATVDPTADDVGAAFQRLTGVAAALVIECVGLPGLIQHAVDVVGVDGRVVIAGVCFGNDTLTPLGAMSKELDVRFAFYYRAGDYRTAIDMIEGERLDPLPLVTDEVSLDELPARFEALKAPSEDCKVLIRPGT
jgi:(R,R)-butanediol dehydrogenase / meso-butanediol dehydrogenase / diacetyl reductase